MAATSPVTYTYDQALNGKGRRTGMMDGSGSTSWDYDPAGQVLTETQAIAGQTYVTGYRYDALRSGPNGLGRLQRMIYPDGEVVTTTYNTQGLPETVAGDDVYLAHAGYNALDQPTGWALGGVLTQALSYDPGTFRLNGLSAANAGGATLQHLDLAFDPLGRLDLYTDHLAGFSLDPTYDPLNRLAGVTSGDYPQDYQYDTIGNLLQRDLLELTYAHASKPHAVTEVFDGQTEDWYQYTYDDNGNRRQRLGGLNDVAYTYDAENRLVKVEESSQVTSFGYDGAGQRVTRLGPGGERTTYAGDHYQLTITGKWSDNVAIYGETGDWQMTPNMVSAADGTLYLVWIEWIEYPQQPGLFQVQFTKRDPAGSWSTPELVREVVEFDYDLFYPAVVVDPAGNVTVAWEEYNPTLADSNIRVRQRDATGSWGSMETVADSSADEKRPSLTAAPDGSVYLAWYRVDAYNQAAVEVARKPISASWTITYQTGNNPVHFLPALTSDSQGNVYLAYVVGYGDMSVPEGDLYIVRREAVSATWAISPELVSDAPHYFWSEDPPALAADSQDNLYVAWGGTIDSSVLLRQRVATTGEWELIQELDAPQSSGLDLVMDGNGVPQWIAGDPRDDSWLPIWFNDVNIVDDDVYHSQYPTLAVGPNGVLVAVWEGDWEGEWHLSYPPRLFTATYSPGGIVTKYYYAGDQPLATRVDDVLYYTLPDPTGTSLAMTKANGDEVGHVLYDGYGAVLTSTLPATLTTTLAGSGDVPDPDTGLVYLGDGRWYDPALGHPLQPNPVGGPLALPQALNRYAATPWGPPGVAEGALSSLPPVVGAFGRQLPGAALSVQGIPQLAQLLTRPIMKTIPIDTGIIEIVGPRASVRFLEAGGFETLAVQPASGLLRGPLSRIFKGLQTQTLRGRMGIAGALAANPAFAEGESISLGRGVTARLVARDIGNTVDDLATQAAARRLANTLGVGVAGILSAGFQYAGDYGNPYLTSPQKFRRSLISGGIGIGAAIVGALIGGPIGFGVGVGLGIVGDLWAAPSVFKFMGDIPKRNLAPLLY